MPDDLKDLIVLDRSQIKPAAETLAQAFHNYPVCVYAYPDADQRNKHLPYFFQFILYCAQRHGEVYATSPQLEGVATWLSSDAFHLSTWQLLRCMPVSLYFRIGGSNYEKMMKCGEYFDSVHQKLINYHHWSLQMIGVKPEYQGKGYGGRLMKPLLERIGKQGFSCYLETEDTKDVPIYQHYDFKIIYESVVPGTDLISRAMLREPKQAANQR